jgi:hypothetical protein
MTYRKPDLKAPRYTKEYKEILNKDLFKGFQEKYPDHKDLSYKSFKQIINTFHGLMRQEVIDYRDGVELPESLGSICICTCRRSSRRKGINFGLSNKLGVAVICQNHHTDGKLGKIFYTNYNQRHRFKNRIMWQFTATRDFSRTVAATYPENWKRYMEVDPNLRINALYRKHMARDMMKAKAEELLKMYNEFDMD